MCPVYVFSIASSHMSIMKRFKDEFDEATIYTTDGTPLQSMPPLIPPRPHSETLAEMNICKYYWQFLWRYFPPYAHTWYRPSLPKTPTTECSASLGTTFSHLNWSLQLLYPFFVANAIMNTLYKKDTERVLVTYKLLDEFSARRGGFPSGGSVAVGGSPECLTCPSRNFSSTYYNMPLKGAKGGKSEGSEA